MITGSVALRHKKCGKPNCRCRRGYPHFVCEVTYKEKGKTKTVYVDKERQGEALLVKSIFFCTFPPGPGEYISRFSFWVDSPSDYC